MFRSYPHNSPYAFSENRVIDGVELEGLEYVSANESVTPDGKTFGQVYGDLYEGQQLDIDGQTYYNVGRDFFRNGDGYMTLSNPTGNNDLITSFPNNPKTQERFMNHEKVSASEVSYSESSNYNRIRPGRLDCFAASCEMSKRLGNETSIYNVYTIQTRISEGKSGKPINSQLAFYYVNKAIENGMGIVMGVDNSSGSANSDGTDHFVVGVGSGWDSGRKQSYVTVFDNNHSEYQDLYWNGTTWHSLDNETIVNQVRVTNTLLKPSKSQAKPLKLPKFLLNKD